MKKKYLVVFLAWFLVNPGGSIRPHIVYAQSHDSVGERAVSEEFRGGEGVHSQYLSEGRLRDYLKSRGIKGLNQEEYQRLLRLRRDNPQRFREVISRLKKHRPSHSRDLHKRQHAKTMRLREADYRKNTLLEQGILFEMLSAKEKARLIKLRSQNPEYFQSELKEALRRQKEFLHTLKSKNPERFRNHIQKARTRIVARMKRLKQEDPQRFKKIQNQHITLQKKRIAKLCEMNPQQCQRMRERFKARQLQERRFKRAIGSQAGHN